MGKSDKEELVRMFVKVPKSKKEMIQKVVEKTSYNTAVFDKLKVDQKITIL